MYFARFETGDGQLLTAAVAWRQEGATLLPQAWRDALLGDVRFDAALRVLNEPSGVSPLLLLSAEGRRERDLAAFCENLFKAPLPAGFDLATDADAFDRLTSRLPPCHLRVDHRGFRHDGQPLACDFRLHPLVCGACGAEPFVYQAHVRAHRPDKETERRVLKYLAWLDVERPFSDSIRAMQRLVAQRLLRNGFRVGEYVAMASEDALVRWRERIDSFFAETTAKIGFPRAPLERGDFSDLLETGCHPERLEEDPELPELAATVFEELEVAELYGPEFLRAPAAAPGGGGANRVFISYASGDYPAASAACRILQENGVPCWMAPRDVNSGLLPYTEAIQRGLSLSRAVVVILSEAANLSAHIPRELDLAIERRLAIVPVRLRDIQPAGQLNYLLRTCQWLNAFDRDFTGAMHELLVRLRP